MNYKDRKEVKENEARITRINNMLATPMQNNMTPAKQEMLEKELEYLYLRNKALYKNAIHEMKQAGY